MALCFLNFQLGQTFKLWESDYLFDRQLINFLTLRYKICSIFTRPWTRCANAHLESFY